MVVISVLLGSWLVVRAALIGRNLGADDPIEIPGMPRSRSAHLGKSEAAVHRLESVAGVAKPEAGGPIGPVQGAAEPDVVGLAAEAWCGR
jgi:hypothetical protein